jgi:hypothetical protein
MSCGGGNRFACGITRFDKHKFTPDKPSNQILHNENENKLNELLRLREEQDKGIFAPVYTNNSISSNTTKLDNFYTPYYQNLETKLYFHQLK